MFIAKQHWFVASISVCWLHVIHTHVQCSLVYTHIHRFITCCHVFLTVLRSFKTVWPSGLRRWLKAPVRKGVGSNPTAVTLVSTRLHKATERSIDVVAAVCFSEVMHMPVDIDAPDLAVPTAKSIANERGGPNTRTRGVNCGGNTGRTASCCECRNAMYRHVTPHRDRMAESICGWELQRYSRA